MAEQQLASPEQPFSQLQMLLRDAAATFLGASVANGDKAAPDDASSDAEAPSVAPFRQFLSAFEAACAAERADDDVPPDAKATLERTQGVLDTLLDDLQGCMDELQTTLDDTPPPPAPPPGAPRTPTADSMRQLLRYAHRLSYTTFAPPGYAPGMPLGHFRPPAPQEWQLRAAALHQAAAEHAAQEGEPGTAPLAQPPLRAAAADPGAAMAAALARMGIQLPEGFMPPPPPPGWKEGDELHIPPELVAHLLQLQQAAGAAAGAPPLAGVAPGAKEGAEEEEEEEEEEHAPAPASVVGMGLDFGLVLNPDIEVASEYEDSDSEDDDFDDDM